MSIAPDYQALQLHAYVAQEGEARSKHLQDSLPPATLRERLRSRFAQLRRLSASHRISTSQQHSIPVARERNLKLTQPLSEVCDTISS